MATDNQVTYTGTIDAGSMLSDIISANPDSPFVQDFFNQMAMPLIKSISNIKATKLQIDISSLLGLTPEYTKNMQREFQRVTQKVLQTIRTQLNRVNRVDLSKDFNLATLFGSTPKMDLINRNSYQDLLGKALGKLRKGVNALKVSDTLDISALFSTTPQMDFFNRNTYQDLVGKALKQLKKAVSSLDISNEFDISSLFGTTPRMDFLNRWYYQELIGKAINKLKTIVSGIQIDGKFDLADLFGSAPDFSFLTRRKYQRVIRDLLTKIDEVDVEALIKNTLAPVGAATAAKAAMPVKPVDKPTAAKAAMPVKPVDKPTAASTTLITKIATQAATAAAIKTSTTSSKGLVEELTEKPEMVVTDFSETAVDKLKKIFRISKTTPIDDKKKPAEGDTNIFGGGLLKFLGMALGGLLGATGIASIVSGLLDSGPMKGLKKFAGMTTIRIAGKLIGKKILGGIAKKIPILGAIVGLGFGISRVIKGDWIGGILELASGIAAIEPGIGTAISIGIDAVLAARDMAEGGPEGIKKSGGMGKWDKKVIDFICSHWPVKGFIEMGEGIKEIYNGNIVKGLKILGHGILGQSGFGLAADIFGEDKVIDTLKDAAYATGDFFKSIYDWIMDTKPIKWIGNITGGISKLFSGDIVGGYRQAGKSIGIFNTLADMFQYPGDVPKIVGKSLSTISPWLGKIVESVTDFIQGVVTSSYDWVRNKLPNWAQKWLPKMPNMLKTGWTGDTAKAEDAPQQKSVIPNASAQQQADALKEHVVQADKLPTQVVQSEAPDTKDLAAMYNNDDVVEGIEGNTGQLAAILGVNQSVLKEFTNLSKQLGLIAHNTKGSNKPSVNVSTMQQQGTGSQRRDTTMRDPAYEFKKDIYGRLSRTV